MNSLKKELKKRKTYLLYSKHRAGPLRLPIGSDCKKLRRIKEKNRQACRT